jgi:hypothetical protein
VRRLPVPTATAATGAAAAVVRVLLAGIAAPSWRDSGGRGRPWSSSPVLSPDRPVRQPLDQKCDENDRFDSSPEW